MKCPACAYENLEGTSPCSSCNAPLNGLKDSPTIVKLDKLALLAAISALVACVCWIPCIISGWDRYVLNPQSDIVILAGLAGFLCTALAFALGIISLFSIATSGGRLTGRGFAAIGTVAPVIMVLLVSINVPFLQVKVLAPRMICGTNLAGLGKAMLIYANDYDDRLPVAGGPGTVWGQRLKDWHAESREKAFGLDPNGTGGAATISSSLYLVIRYIEVKPESFVCKGESRPKVFRPRKHGLKKNQLTSAWDFGPDPAKYCSYSYHLPYGQYALTVADDPDMAVAADRNPWIDDPRRKAAGFSLFKPELKPFDGTVEEARKGNTRAHNHEGQNVLFLDCHVNFEKRAYCAMDGDNIYTSWDGPDKTRGLPPQPFISQPSNRSDSLLANDPPASR